MLKGDKNTSDGRESERERESGKSQGNDVVVVVEILILRIK